MPGLVDGHMHPLDAGTQPHEVQSRTTNPSRSTRCSNGSRHVSTRTASREPDGWLDVVNWFQESMRPAGVKTSRATLDVLKTSRPIIVHSSFGHTVLANTRALVLAGITASTPDPLGGKIWRDAAGEPTGLLEDAAYEPLDSLLPKPTAEENVAAAKPRSRP